MKVIRMVPADSDGLGTTRNHALGAITDYTLCGFTLDGDTRAVTSAKEIDGQITCEQCWLVLEHCRTIKQKRIGKERPVKRKRAGQESSMPKDCSTSQKPTKHTPGKWKVSRKFPEELVIVAPSGLICAVPSDSMGTSQGWRTPEEAEANARLFAAAPDLLDALESALSLFDKDHALSRFNWGASDLRAEDIRELNELPRKIREAIAQATGEVR